MFRFAKQGGSLGSVRVLTASYRTARALLMVHIGVASALGCTEEVRLGRVLGRAGSGEQPSDASAGRGGQSPAFPLGGGAGEAGSPASPDGDAAAPGAAPCVPVSCGQSTPFACGNCEDDDGDGWVDASDPECLGPCDDSELELYSGVESPVTGSCRSDCYFDRNSGSGDDGCSWSYRCDPGSVAPAYPPTGSVMCSYEPSLPACQPGSAELDACRGGCLALTPNGCDCFGCCELPAGSDRFVWLGSPQIGEARCEIATSSDSDACRPCTPVFECQNPCEECELCIGKTELPATCSGAPGPACPDGVRSCDPRTGAGCSVLEYCITGCCVPLPA